MTATQPSSLANTAHNKVTFVPLTPGQVPKCVDLLINSFLDEPHCHTLQFTEDDLAGVVGIHVKRAAQQSKSLSTVALIDGEIVAVFNLDDFTKPLVPESDDFYKKAVNALGQYKIQMET